MRKAWERLTGGARSSAQPADRSVHWGARPGLRLLGSVLFNAATLPLARLQLELLARRPHQGVTPLPRFMTAEAAAQPTPPRHRSAGS